LLRRLWIVALTLMVLVSPIATASAASADYDVANGHFFTQTGGGTGQGYLVLDAGQDKNGNTIKLWSEFKRLGGLATLGYPVSKRYIGPGGFLYQAFQRGVLQWRYETNRAVLSNTFEWLQDNGKDSWLKAAKGVPSPITDDGSGGDYGKAVQTRFTWLTDSAIKAKYLANPNPSAISGWNNDRAIELYGLPMSQPEKSGPFITQRFQRVALQLWVESVPGMPAKGTVVGVLGGDLVKEVALIPTDAAAPGPDNDATINPTAVPVQTPVATPAPPYQPTPAPTSPPAPTAQPTPPPPANYSWHYEMKGWFSNCGVTYVFGHVYNRSGGLQNGISVKTWNEWGNAVISGSGSDSSRGDGGWVRLVNGKQNPQTWFAAIVDGSGNQASPTFTIKFEADCNSGAQVVELDFREN